MFIQFFLSSNDRVNYNIRVRKHSCNLCRKQLPVCLQVLNELAVFYFPLQVQSILYSGCPA